jgi:hypothetical protein
VSRATAIVDKLLEADEFNPREYFLTTKPLPGKRILISYEIFTEESMANGDAEESGWIDAEGEDMEPDEWDREENITAARKAANFLNDKGAIHGSSSHFHPGIWYKDSGGVNNLTGEEEQRSYHLKGFTLDEEEFIFNEVHMRI